MAVANHHREAAAVRDPWNVFGGGTPATGTPVGSLSTLSPPPGRTDRWEPPLKKRIGEILVGAGVISVETRDSVLEYQAWNHVSFGTALLEAGKLPENLFLRALSVQFAVPSASGADLESIPPGILALVKSRIAERHSVIPFRKVGRTLHLAMARPSDEPAIRSIALLTGLTVVPHVAIAARVALAIEKHYGVPAPAHFKVLARIFEEMSASAAREDSASRATPVFPKAVPSGAQMPQRADLRAVEPETERPPALPTWQQLTGALCEARNPDQVANALLDFLTETVGPAALYRVRGSDAVLWKAWPASAPVNSLSIPISADSVFASSRDGAGPFAGPCPDTRENRQILASLGGRMPGSVVVVPVRLNDKPILFLVGQPGSGEPLIDGSSYRRLAKIAATALGLVALHRRLQSL